MEADGLDGRLRDFLMPLFRRFNRWTLGGLPMASPAIGLSFRAKRHLHLRWQRSCQVQVGIPEARRCGTRDRHE